MTQSHWSGEAETVTCPHCDGRCIFQDDEHGQIVCHVCHGSGEVTEHEARQLLEAFRAERA